jgi:hypothetical protein
MTKPKKVPIKKRDQPTVQVIRATETQIFEAEDRGYWQGRKDGEMRATFYERRKVATYRAQGAFFGSCLTGIIIIIIVALI